MLTYVVANKKQRCKSYRLLVLQKTYWKKKTSDVAILAALDKKCSVCEGKWKKAKTWQTFKKKLALSESKSLRQANPESVPSTSGLNKGGKHIHLSSNVDSDSVMSVPKAVFMLFLPWLVVWRVTKLYIAHFRNIDQFMWCSHWNDLKYCWDVRKPGWNDSFRCLHCPQEEE